MKLWPSDFDKRSYTFKDKRNREWRTEITVTNNWKEYINLYGHIFSYEYLVVVDNWPEKERNPHCMYVHCFKNKSQQQVHCINSWGKGKDCHPDPWVDFKYIIKFYTVSCNAFEIDQE